MYMYKYKYKRAGHGPHPSEVSATHFDDVKKVD